ncbi:MAG: hypothetical protein E6704_07015 [Anaerococcus prevotii]|nr:hypothetical protein [Anaerococcus prevotii]
MLALGMSIAALVISIVNISRIAKRNKKTYKETKEFNEYLKKELEKLYGIENLSEEEKEYALLKKLEYQINN